MVQYPQEKIAPRSSVLYDSFLSVDFAKASANVKPYYSPNAVNMIRDEYGKVRRRMGYFDKYPNLFTQKIWGIHYFQGNYIIHSGTGLYQVVNGILSMLYEGMNEHLSFSFQESEKIYFLDGKEYLVYDGINCTLVEGTVPIVMIAGSPNGGGTTFQQVNLIQNKWEQWFAGNGTGTTYQLAFDSLDTTAVEVKKARLNNGQVVWDKLTENQDFTVNRALGQIIFVVAPSVPVVAQEDNIKVIASKDRSEGRKKITGCTIYKPFGINGYENQVFISGNAEQANKVFWSAVNDPTYFGDLQYAVLGQDNSAVTSFSVLNTQLICHKDTKSGKSYLCSPFAATINNLAVPQLKVEKVINGSGCIGKYTSANIGEPIFLTSLGLQAITYKDLTNQEIETLRGDRINRKLLQEPNLEQAIACVYKYFYLLSVNGNLYILDRLNPQGESNVLSNAYQYNGFFWNHIPATCFYTDGSGVLMFGTVDGKVMEFYTNEQLSSSYNDNGVTYEWLWEFPEYVGTRFYNNKAIKYVALRAKAYIRTSVIVDVQLNGLWHEVLRDKASFGFLDLSDLDLNNLNLSTDTTPKKTTEKYQERKLDKFAWRVRGDSLNEPFGLYSFAFEVKEKGKHKQ